MEANYPCGLVSSRRTPPDADQPVLARDPAADAFRAAPHPAQTVTEGSGDHAIIYGERPPRVARIPCRFVMGVGLRPAPHASGAGRRGALQRLGGGAHRLLA